MCSYHYIWDQASPALYANFEVWTKEYFGKLDDCMTRMRLLSWVFLELYNGKTLDKDDDKELKSDLETRWCGHLEWRPKGSFVICQSMFKRNEEVDIIFLLALLIITAGDRWWSVWSGSNSWNKTWLLWFWYIAIE